MARLTQDVFIERCKKAHGDKYDYSKAVYVKNSEKVVIVCNEHGEFSQAPEKHWIGRGCPECKKVSVGNSLRADPEVVFNKCAEVHQGKYDYSKAVYINLDTKVEIICKEHGSFMQTPANHRKGKGCPLCKNSKISKLKTLTKDVWVKRFKDAHGERYDYSNFDPANMDHQHEIVCKQHGPFSQDPHSHASGKGCPKCAQERSSQRQMKGQEQAMEEIKEKWGDKYTYPSFHYKGHDGKLVVNCPLHGDFSTTFGNHISGHGCPRCAYERISLARMVENREVKQRAMEIHGGKYSYEWMDYKGMKKSIKILCNKHGEFTQMAETHLSGSGCPDCATPVSKGEQELYDVVLKMCPDAVQSDHSVLGRRELDIYIPSKKIAIEFNGVYWHSDKIKPKKYHYDKWKDCKEKGIRLIQILDIDWKNNREKMLSIIKHAIGNNDLRKVNARQCIIVDLKAKEVENFFYENHPQGPVRNPINHGLISPEGDLVAVMSFGFGKTSRGSSAKTATWELSRYATSCVVRGGASKLFKHFLRTYCPKEVKSFSMNDWFGGGLYEKLGFVGEEIPVDYRVYHPKLGIVPKSKWQRREIPKRIKDLGIAESYDPSTDKRTEKEMEDLMGALRIWDSGKIRWELVL